MKKQVLLAACAFMCCSLFAEDLGFSISVEPVYNMRFSKINESVWQKGSANSQTLVNKSASGNGQTVADRLYSNNEWNDNFVSEAGLDLKVGFDLFNIEGSFIAAIPQDCGKLYTTKYLDDYNPSYIIYKTESTNKKMEDFDVNAKISIDFPLTYNFTVSPSLGFNYDLTKYQARDETGKAGIASLHIPYDSVAKDATERSASTVKNEGVISIYQRELYDFNVGLTLEGYFFDCITVQLQGYVTPFLIFNAKDSRTGLYYLDMNLTSGTFPSFENAFFRKFSWGGSVEYELNDNLSVGASLIYQLLTETTATTYNSQTSADSGFKLDSDFYSKTSGYTWSAKVYGKYSFYF